MWKNDVTSILISKKAIRKSMKAKRDRLSPEQVANKSRLIQERIMSMDIIKKSNLIMCYVNMKNEVITTEMIRKFLDMGKSVVVPVCNTSKGTLIASKIKDLSELLPSYFGIMEPDHNRLRPVDGNTIDVILLPGIAFDREGNRLGYGKGYYDNFISSLEPVPYKIALAYGFQLIDRIPAEAHDIPVDCIVTENELYFPQK